MSLDELWQLHEELNELLSVRLSAEKRALDQQLLNDAAAAGPDRRPNRDLFAAPENSCQKQIGQVRAGDQQNACNRAK